MYIKMDDDIVFMEDSVIPSLVSTKASRPDIFVVSANVVNQPMLSWVHWNLGAIKPYLPEFSASSIGRFFHQDFNWRPSALPDWTGKLKSDFDASDWYSPSKTPHRWLPIRGDDAYILANRTPIAKTEYDPFGIGWRRWQVAAQEHYSMLENLENNELWRYKFNIWDFQTARMGIQLVALMGKDINDAKPIAKDDEHHFAVTMPKKTGRRKFIVASIWCFMLMNYSRRCRRPRCSSTLQFPYAAQTGWQQHDRNRRRHQHHRHP